MTKEAGNPSEPKLYVIENLQPDIPNVTENIPGELQDMPDFHGVPNIGYRFATQFESEQTGMRFHKGCLEPGGKIAAHAGDREFILYVIHGSGLLKNIDNEENVVSTIAYKTGDIIVFRKDTMHYWENGDETLEFAGFDISS